MGKCIVCNSLALKEVDHGFSGSVTSDNKFINMKVVHSYCKNCGIIFIDEKHRIMNLEDFYLNEYTFLLDSEDVEPVEIKGECVVKASENLVEKFSEFIKNEADRTFLDIGSGKGNFVEALHKCFPTLSIYALEPSKSFELLKNKKFLKGSFNTFFDETIFRGQRFDYVSLIGVLEHVPNPREFLLDVQKVMKDSGFIFIEVPNFKNNKADLLTADHLIKFTEESITNLINVAELEIVKRITKASVPMQFVVKRSHTRAIRNFDIEPVVENAKQYLLKVIDDAHKIKKINIAVYGQGLILEYLVGTGVLKLSNIKCIIDDNFLYQGKKWKEVVDIVSFEEFKKKIRIKDIFLAMNDCYHEKVIGKLTGFNVFGRIR